MDNEAYKLFVGNLPFSATEDDIRALFSPFVGEDGGDITIFLPLNRENNLPRGFGFVTMPDEASYQAVLDAFGSDPKKFMLSDDRGERQLEVNKPKPREERPAGGNRGGYGGGGGNRGGGGGGYGGGSRGGYGGGSRY